MMAKKSWLVVMWGILLLPSSEGAEKINTTEETILRDIEKELELMQCGFNLSAEDRAILDQPQRVSRSRYFLIPWVS
ncbi:MAG: hypothetical protein HY879_24075 [Deltaproteobacteria bacterium]|nr:hypothetical protein [Deltaproteobacteria bacterium]